MEGPNPNQPLDPQRWDRIRVLFHETLARPELERAAFLARACADDEALLQEVHSLLTAHADAEGQRFLACSELEEPVDTAPSRRVQHRLAAAGSSAGGMQWERIQTVLDKTLELPPEEHEAYLDAACAGDGALRAELDALLAASNQTGPLDRPTEIAVTTLPPLPPGALIGPYRVARVLGEGGMGIVYLAEQEHPIKRQVAVKLIKIGMDTAEVIARFESERQALALMDHPNITRVFDAGSSADGRAYFAMEYVSGEPIGDYCDRHRLNTRARLDLIVQVARALHHAHQRGVVHRDIKPSNVLVDLRDGQPMAKVIDFGLAKALNRRLTERTLFTQRGLLIGTPEYMSPEQADLCNEDVDARTDVYALGLLLYELLVGVLPFDREELRDAGYLEILRIIREHDPPRPTLRLQQLGTRATDIARRRGTELRSLAKQLSGDVEWITLKALEKDRARRYSSAAELAEDVERHLRDEPVLAGRPNAAYRLYRRVKRSRARGLIGLTITVATVATLVPMVWLRQDRTMTGRTLVQLTRDSGLTTDAAVSRGALPRIVFEVHPPPGGEFDSVAISPDGTRLAFESLGRIWIRALSGVQATDVQNSTGGIDPFWSPDGRYIAFFKSGRLWKASANGGEPAVLCDAPHALGGSWGRDNTILFAGGLGKAIYRVPAYGGAPQALRTARVNGLYELRWPVVLPSGDGFIYSAQKEHGAQRAIYFARFDGTTDRALVSSNSNAYATDETLFYVKQGVLYAHPFDRERGRLTGAPTQIDHRLDPSPYHLFHAGYSVSPQGVVAYLGRRQVDRELRVVDRTGRTTRVLTGPGEFHDIALSRDGTRLAYEERDGAAGTTDIWVVDIESGSRTQISWGAGDETCPTWSADDQQLLFVARGEGDARLFRKSANGSGRATEMFRFRGDAQPYDISPNGRWLAFQQLGHETVWDIHLLDLLARPERNEERVTIFHRTPHADDEPRFSPDGRYLAYSSRDSGDRFVFFEEVDRTTGQRWRVSPSYGRQPQWRADGQEIYYHGANRMLMAAPIDLSGETPGVGSPTPLFELAFRGWDLRYHYAAFPDGQQFVLNAPREGLLPPPVTVVLNWEGR